MAFDPKIPPEAVAKAAELARRTIARGTQVVEEAAAGATALIKDSVEKAASRVSRRGKVPQVTEAAATDLANGVAKGGEKIAFEGAHATNADLARALKGKKDVVEADLSLSKITGDGVATLAKFRNLRVLDLSSMDRISNKGLTALAGMPKLEVLDLSLLGGRFTNEGLAVLKTFPRLKWLDLHTSHFDARGLVHLEGLKGLEHLKFGDHLSGGARDLAYKPLADADLKHISGLTNLRSLEYLDRIGDAGMAHLRGLTKLEKLYFRYAKVTDAGIAHLQGMKLRELNLGSMSNEGKITDKSMKIIGAMTDMRKLSLSGTAITDKGVAELAGLTELRELSLGDANQVTDAALKHLEGMQHLRQLIVGDGVTEAAAKRLAKKIPGLKVMGNWPTWPGI